MDWLIPCSSTFFKGLSLKMALHPRPKSDISRPTLGLIGFDLALIG
jgi:hypothetical protein